VTDVPALLVVGHGTRDTVGVAAFRAFVDLVRRRSGGTPVGGGFIELSAPPLAEAMADLVGQGVRRFAAVPLVLVAAGHAKGDIPAALARERLRHPGTSYAYGRPIGPHAAVLELLDRRLGEVLDATERADTAVLLVGRGSSDPDANAEVVKVARLLWEGRGFAFAEAAFISLAWPGVPEGLDRCRRLGARRVVVLPYFLFPGVLPARTVAQTTEWAAAQEGIEVRCAGLLTGSAAYDETLADIVLERYHESIHGDLRMNCDTCIYRVALPGFAHRVGAPQLPHHHPDDPTHHHAHDHHRAHHH
jgi:sirohydrochlorin cobaltochelatase